MAWLNVTGRKSEEVGIQEWERRDLQAKEIMSRWHQQGATRRGNSMA